MWKICVCVWLFLACENYGVRFDESFNACALKKLAGDQFAHQFHSFRPRISPQSLSELR